MNLFGNDFAYFVLKFQNQLTIFIS